jgi:D-alanyl-D-alanine carboxypeptidase
MFVFWYLICTSLICTTEANIQKVKKAAIVVDYTANQKVVFAENANERCFPASLTKLMTAYIFLEEFDAGRITRRTNFRTSKLAAGQISSKLGLAVGESVPAVKLLEAICVKSANDAAVVIAEGISGDVQSFVSRMNRTARKLGMYNTHFENPSGVPNKNQYTTARDMAILAMNLFKRFGKKYWHFFSQKSCEYNGKKHQTHAKILMWYAGADGAKTGFINASGFNLFVTAQKCDKKGRPRRVFVVVFGRDSSRIRDLYAAGLMNKYLADHTIATVYNLSLEAAIAEEPKKKTKSSPFASIPIDDGNVAVTKPSKQKAKPPRVVDEGEVLEVISEEEITFDQINGYSKEQQVYIEELYINGDEEKEFLEDEEIIIKAQRRSQRTKK